VKSVIPIHDLPGSERSHTFVGADYGGIPVSFFLVHSQPGEGPELHRHPYAEVFVVEAGQATFVLGDDTAVAGPGEIVIAPAMVSHRFTNTGTGQLRLTAIHPVSAMETEWLETTADPAAAR
jgi:mannose-6-phosphate isomerase-like protein (cupin superfamily)